MPMHTRHFPLEEKHR
uniref:SPX domain-containing membrane protein At4g22990-like isoform X2 n=1 Tax=Rhizophora mucronata TaxID=61149 RepID=A0A2P2LL34_RHIMU